MRLVRHADLVPQPWKNGGGSTREVCAFPPGATLDNFDWRLSMATVAEDGPFSAFPGIDRVLMVLAGGGLHLNLPEGDHRLMPGQMLSFAGETPVHASLPAGPIQDLNLMVRRDRFSGRMVRHRLASGASLAPDASVRAVVVQEGAVQSAADLLGPGDTLLIESVMEARLVTKAESALVLISLNVPIGEGSVL
ncbi:MAG: HutD family protein [Rhodobacterales bacterium]|nr:HutD family protein [Rhodobacterales bacterium]